MFQCLQTQIHTSVSFALFYITTRKYMYLSYLKNDSLLLICVFLKSFKVIRQYFIILYIFYGLKSIVIYHKLVNLTIFHMQEVGNNARIQKERTYFRKCVCLYISTSKPHRQLPLIENELMWDSDYIINKIGL